MRNIASLGVFVLVLLLLMPHSVGAIPCVKKTPGLIVPSPDERHVASTYTEQRQREQIEEFMALKWQTPRASKKSWEIANPDFEEMSKAHMNHSRDFNGTADPVLLFSAFNDSHNDSSSECCAFEGSTNQESTETYMYSETREYRALPISPAKEGHWFRKKSYSALAFQWDYPAYILSSYIRMDIERNLDQYSRYLTVYFDGSIIYHAVIGSAGFHGSVPVQYVDAGTHKVEVEIHYGGWKERQWKMTYIWPWTYVPNWPDEPIPDFWEYFPGGHSDDINPTLDYQVKVGDSTYFDLYVDDVGGSSRQIEIYRKTSLSSNWNYWKTVSSGTAYKMYMSYYTPGSNYYIRLKLLESPAGYYEQKVVYNCINYRVTYLEVDYLSDSSGNPVMDLNDISEMMDYVQTYYILHGYARPDYWIDDKIPFDPSHSTIYPNTWRNLHMKYHDHYTFEWVMIAQAYYLTDSNGWHSIGGAYYVDEQGYDWGIAIFDSGLYRLSTNPPWGYGYGSYIQCAKTVLLHEFGHYAGILETDFWGYEVYCSNPACCMSVASDESIIPEPWYCAYHWSLRDSKFDP